MYNRDTLHVRALDTASQACKHDIFRLLALKRCKGQRVTLYTAVQQTHSSHLTMDGCALAQGPQCKRKELEVDQVSRWPDPIEPHGLETLQARSTPGGLGQIYNYW
jgi:hypothetical protein